MAATITDAKSYLASLPADRRAAISAVLDVVRRRLPRGYVETIGYGMIVWVVPKSVEPDTYNGQPLMYAALASQKSHMSLYVMCGYLPEVADRLREGFRRAGKRLDMGKSCIRFKRLEDLPLDVIGEAIGRLDSAATIYRSLGKSAHATRDLLMLWFGSCERRGDHAEAALVACDLGDRALNDGEQAEALGWFERARNLDPANELASRRLQRLQPAASSPAVAVATEAAPEAEPAPDTVEAASAAPAQELKPAAPTGLPEAGRVEVAVGRGEAVTFDLGALIGEFQRGVEAQLSGDAQSHYDLGMAYREMGLLEQALDSFRIAGQDPAYRERVIEMVGRCLLDQGRFDDATQAFEEALMEPAADGDHRASLRFLLGLAHEAAGRMDEALEAFESVYAEQPSFPDVAQKIRVLRKTPESR